MVRMHVANELEAVALGEGDGDDNDIRLEVANGNARLALALCFPADLEVRLFVDHQAQALPHDRMIVDDAHFAFAGTEPRAARAGPHGSRGQVQRTDAPPSADASSTRSPPSI